MNFYSDNVSRIAPEIMAAIVAINSGTDMPYGDDECSQRLAAQFSDLFETSVKVFPVASGSAANALALSTMTTSLGAIYCHAESQINIRACGAPEFYTGGAKLVTLPGSHGKICASDLAVKLAHPKTSVARYVKPAVVSITQATEAGTVYSAEELYQIAEITHAHNLYLHMDGTRFANAVSRLGCSPADITWRSGVDVLSFGATKNGAMLAEAVVFFNPDLSKTFSYYCKRSGHLLSKMMFLSVQLEAYITNNLWLKNAAHANKMAAMLAEGLTSLPGGLLCHPVETNQVFIDLPEVVIKGLLADGFRFFRWDGEHSNTIRLVTSFNTRETDVISFLEAARRHSVLLDPLLELLDKNKE